MVGKILGVIVMCAALAVVSAEVDASILDNGSERQGRFSCSGFVSYQVTIRYQWSAATHPFAYPSNGRFSPSLVVTHGKGYVLWTPNGFASQGVERMAEQGLTGLLIKELVDQRNRNVQAYRRSSGPTADGTQAVRNRISTNGAHSYMASISMMVPSPDWFTGIQEVNLCDEGTGRWKTRLEGNLSVWDSGTDSGTNFNSPNRDIKGKNRRPILSILASKFRGKPIGTYTIRLV